MRKLMPVLLRWIFPNWYTDTAKCITCGTTVSKIRMVRSGNKWFCSEDEAYEYWINTVR